jgi:uncharacterized DUF497 family protein
LRERKIFSGYTALPYDMRKMDFEWDRLKAATNLVKHGIDFTDALDVFEDMELLIIVDRQRYSELRYRAIGRVDDQVLSVAYLMKAEVCRIISARRASRNERKHYRTLSAGP